MAWYGLHVVCVWVLACIFCVLYQRHGIISQISLHTHIYLCIIISFEYSYPVAIVKGLNDNGGGDDGGTAASTTLRSEMHICKSVGISVHWQQYFNLLSYLLCESIFILLIFKPMILFAIMECLLASYMHTYQQINTDAHIQTHHVSRSMMEKLLLWISERGRKREHLFLERRKNSCGFWLAEALFSASFPFYSSKRQFNQAPNLWARLTSCYK